MAESVTNGRIFIYRIDEDDTIVALNEEWIQFAQENQAPTLTRENVVGQPLERFVAGWETRHLYEMIYEKVRRTGRDVVFPFRCDSPDQKRSFQMRIARTQGKGLEFSVTVIRIEARLAHPLLNTSVEHSSDVVVICSWCKRIQMEGREWLETEEAIGTLNLFGPIPPTLTHEVCPECLEMIHRQLTPDEDN